MTQPSNPSLTPIEVPGSNQERMLEAYKLFEQREFDQAAAIAQRLVDRIRRLPERRRSAHSDLSMILIGAGTILTDIKAEQGDWDAVDALCQQLAQLNPGYETSWPRRACVLRIENDRVEEGMAGLRAITEAEPDNCNAWLILARRALEIEDYDLAEIALQRGEEAALLYNDSQGLGEIYLSRFYLRWLRQEWQAAGQAWETARQYDPEVVELQESVVRMYLEAGLLDDALSYIDDDVLSRPLANYFRAWIANQRGDQVRARYLWRTVAEGDLAELETDITTLQAMSHCWLRQPETALSLLLQGTWRDHKVRYLDAIALALAWAMNGDKEAALANLKLASKRDASKARPNQLLGYFHWLDFEQLVEDEAIKAELRPSFRMPRSAAP
jgi:tetratricopeptide (TPR) repeat protein